MTITRTEAYPMILKSPINAAQFHGRNLLFSAQHLIDAIGKEHHSRRFDKIGIAVAANGQQRVVGKKLKLRIQIGI